jgi:hypothetical protein
MKMYHCDAYNNIYGVYIGADTPGSEAPSANVDIKNNIIKNNTTGMFVAAGSESGLASDNNAWHNNTSFINYNGAGYTSATWQAAGSTQQPVHDRSCICQHRLRRLRAGRGRADHRRRSG